MTMPLRSIVQPALPACTKIPGPGEKYGLDFFPTIFSWVKNVNFIILLKKAHLERILTLFQILLLVFLVVPILEIYLLIKVGGIIGALPTIFLVVFTAVLGAWLIRLQGFSTLRRVRESLARGEIPAVEMLGGVLLAIAGALLLTPGFFTDSIGFLLLIPVVRHRAVLWFLERANWIQVSVGRQGAKHHHPPRDREPQGPRTLDGEYWRDDDK
jgi:UPF0716 protein FxsA